jgi:hypothetical protein
VQQAAPPPPPGFIPVEAATAPENPGFVQSLGQAAGAPTSPEEAGSLLTNNGKGDSPFDQPRSFGTLGTTFNPGIAAENIVAGIGQGVADRVKSGSKQIRESVQNLRAGGPLLPNFGKGLSGIADYTAAANPVISAGGEGGQKVARGDYAGAAGTFVGGGMQGVLAGHGLDRPTAPNLRASLELPKKITAPLLERGGPQMAAMPRETAGLPREAVAGAEQIYRAAAPTGANTNFRANLYAATPDLAEIAGKVEQKLAATKGGIRNPDMRLHAVVEEIGNHLDEMYKTERAPQIQRNANVPIAAKLGPDAARGLEFLSSNAGKVADQMLADRAIAKGTLTIAEADQLAQTANQELRAYERLPKDQQLLMRGTNPKIAGLKALDEGLKRALNEELKQRGEPGLTDYERRYAGLAEVRRGLRSRLNEVELKQPGVIKGVAQPIGRAVGVLTGGGRGMVSASQAALADVNVGSTLADGLAKLRKSGIRPRRAIRTVPGTR